MDGSAGRDLSHDGFQPPLPLLQEVEPILQHIPLLVLHNTTYVHNVYLIAILKLITLATHV